MLPYIHQITSCLVKNHMKEWNWWKLAEIPSWKVKTVLRNPVRRAPEPYALRAFPPVFGALPGIQIELMIARWKGMDVYFPTQVEFSNLVSIFPSKSAFSQDCFLCVQKGAVRSFFTCFLTFWGPKVWWNALTITEHVYFIMTNQKMQSICDLDLPIVWVARDALPVEPKNLFFNQNFKIDKIFSKFLEIWAGGPQSSTMLSQRGFGQNPKMI